MIAICWPSIPPSSCGSLFLQFAFSNHLQSSFFVVTYCSSTFRSYWCCFPEKSFQQLQASANRARCGAYTWCDRGWWLNQSLCYHCCSKRDKLRFCLRTVSLPEWEHGAVPPLAAGLTHPRRKFSLLIFLIFGVQLLEELYWKLFA